MKMAEMLKTDNMHHWNGLVEHVSTTDEFFEQIEGNVEDTVRFLQSSLKVNEYVSVQHMPATNKSTLPFVGYLNQLKRAGLDIGKGNSQYGYKMPLPKLESESRELIVFRRF